MLPSTRLGCKHGEAINRTSLIYAQGFIFSESPTLNDTHWQDMGMPSGWTISKFKFGLPTRFGMGYENMVPCRQGNAVTIATWSSFGQGIGWPKCRCYVPFQLCQMMVSVKSRNLSHTIYDSKTGGLVISAKKLSVIQFRNQEVYDSGQVLTMEFGEPVIQVAGQDVASRNPRHPKLRQIRAIWKGE